MKIIDISLTQERIKLKVPFITALREVHFAEFIRVKVCCEDGCFAYGEAPATKAITGETLVSIEKDINTVKELFYGYSIDEAMRLLHLQKIGSSAKAALDIAFISLYAKEKKFSLRDYFDMQDISSIKTDVTISLGTKEQMLLDAKEALREGMDILKIKLGSNIAHATEVTRVLSAELPHAKLLIDANQAWSEAQTLHYLKATEDCKLELLEQPVAAKELGALQRITKMSKVPILADEALFTLEDAEYVIQNRVADMINIKLMKCGGVTKAVEILEYARAKGVGCMLGSMIEGPYSINITLYLAFAYRDVVQFVDLDSPLLYEKLPSELDFIYNEAVISFKEQ
ncbi:dipeptide epimerase [Sulfurimonas sp. NWX79]|uniref:dipeptide epimerase n=1 Tax=Sulfurimonas sp. NWX79 TaxID=2925412 RepID=UPI003204FA8B